MVREKVFVSRQSVSNWENDKTYPDIKSLLLLSEVFQVSLDQLVKGDLEIMKKEINTQEPRHTKKSVLLWKERAWKRLRRSENPASARIRRFY